jgi:hypothetical protein
MSRTLCNLLLAMGLCGLCSLGACNNRDVVLGTYLPADAGVHGDAANTTTEPDAGNDAGQPRKDGGDDHKTGHGTAGSFGPAPVDAGHDAQVHHDGDDAGDH